MNKIKILFYTGGLDYGGTWRSHERLMEGINWMKYDPYIMYWDECPGDNRLEIVREKFGQDRLIPFKRSQKKQAASTGYLPEYTNFYDVAIKQKFDIIHYARSGYYEWPFNKRMAPLQIETNIFGGKDESPFLDKSIAICNYIKNVRGKSDAVIYNPIPLPEKKVYDLRQQLNIPQDSFVFGRIGRADNFHPVGIDTFAKLVKLFPNIYYVIIGACDSAKQRAANIPNIRIVEPTNDDNFINAFHHTIDAMLHYRMDGEVHSTAIAQAMVYGIPIISHISCAYNGQIETIGNGGYVAFDEEEYYNAAKQVIIDKNYRERLSTFALEESQRFLQPTIIKQYEDCLEKWYNEQTRK